MGSALTTTTALVDLLSGVDYYEDGSVGRSEAEKRGKRLSGALAAFRADVVREARSAGPAVTTHAPDWRSEAALWKQRAEAAARRAETEARVPADLYAQVERARKCEEEADRRADMLATTLDAANASRVETERQRDEAADMRDHWQGVAEDAERERGAERGKTLAAERRAEEAEAIIARIREAFERVTAGWKGGAA